MSSKGFTSSKSFVALSYDTDGKARRQDPAKLILRAMRAVFIAAIREKMRRHFDINMKEH
jgi:hypothetical protein